MFDTLLVANRGEIACRVLRTARRLGLRTVAVYSDADARAMHVEMADEAIRIGPAAARESYLNVEAILAAATRAGAQAIHPGYGFLSENADFAAACKAAGLVFVGPPESAIRAMGSKIGAKRLMESSGVPLVPGYHGDAQDAATLTKAAAEIGYPVLIKASAGGGGKGMRIANAASELQSQLESARREAAKAFGDDRLLLERCLREPRHIEIQVFADTHGNCIHLHERDCSIQRRHQKIIEEAPAPGLSAERRAAMGEAAIRAARRVGYAGAGTVEFLASGDEFYFMEMNTRLQVEHPVTEMITGLDLVEWQLRIAAGERLPLSQEQVPLQGHALEARIYAEDPDRHFLPSTGHLWHVRWPERTASVRVDTGVREGDDVTVHYDPMLAKLIVWAETRHDAIASLRRALSRCELAGVTTNIGLLQAVSEQPGFAAGDIHTGFLAQHAASLSAPPDSVQREKLAALAACGFLLAETQQRSSRGAAQSPWAAADGWRLNASALIGFDLREEPGRVASRRIHMAPEGRGWLVNVGEHAFRVDAPELAHGRIRAQVDGKILGAGWRLRGEEAHLFAGGRHLVFSRAGGHDAEQGAADPGSLKSPMPGQVIQVLVSPGVGVRRGQPLMIVEAMKMEHTVVAPSDGVVEAIGFSVGDRVEEGAQLLRLKSVSGSSGA